MRSILADALDCFWNAAIGEAHNRQSAAAMDVASVMATGFAAVAARLREDDAGGVTVRTEKMNDVFSKVFVEGLPFPVIYHIFTGVEPGDPHDHPFNIYVTVRSGWYDENIFNSDGSAWPMRRNTGDSFLVPAERIHQITAMAPEGCVTEVRYGPHKRTSRFWQFRDDGAWSRAWNETEWTKELAL